MNPNTRFTRRGAAALALTGLAAGRAAWAQDSQPVTIIVPYPAGGASDIVARRIAPHLAKALKMPVVVQNIPGAGGAIGAQKLLASPADGRTLFYGSPNELILVPTLNAAVKYKPTAFVPVGITTRTPMILVARTGLPVKNADELQKYARNAPRELTYGSVGAGSFQHVLGAHIGALMGVKLLHVPYTGAAPMYNDMLGQQVDIAVATLSGGALDYVKGGKVTSLGMLTRERSPLAPQFATVQESHALKGVNFTTWGGLFVRATTPAPLVERLQAAFREAIAVTTLRAGIRSGGSEPMPPMTAAEQHKLYRDDAARYAKLVKDLNIRIEP
ncbi:tripartite tricarboxylate transporter substrate binding protein [Variovorax sp. dw_954]|uniref:tripartite tricarboxylate transporter substrate binding protein n=1 Tax=Variovorax sp. dw_954 TaxID=2720078 RepID=UPI001BD61728|nr:tripartite tricarboxylate transporter substrate binding protein [Variovorax sp. dw_954]